MVRSVYKKVVVGEIPDDWKVAVFGEHFNVFAGLGFKKSEYATNGLNLVRIDNVSYGRITWESIEYLPDSYSRKFPNLVLGKGDILLALNRPITNGQLKMARLTENDLPAILYQRVGKVVAIGDDFDNEYAFYVLGKHIKKFVEETAVGTDQPFISTTKLKKLEFPVAEKPKEQKAIAKALSDTDALITAIEKLIEKKRAIKTATMQQLLTGKTRLPEFGEGKGYKDSELGRIPEDWDVVRLGDLLTVHHGRDQKPVQCANGKYPILATGGVIGSTNKWLYDKPSVLIGRKGTINKPQYMDSPFWTVDTLFYTEINKKTDPKYLFFKFQQIDWMAFNEASGVPSLNSSTINSISISVPKDADEQRAISNTISAMEREIETTQCLQNKYRQIKQAMMQQLLTGRTRLV